MLSYIHVGSQLVLGSSSEKVKINNLVHRGYRGKGAQDALIPAGQKLYLKRKNSAHKEISEPKKLAFF
jgi:hypothetical protein